MRSRIPRVPSRDICENREEPWLCAVNSRLRAGRGRAAKENRIAIMSAFAGLFALERCQINDL
jgi:hypothetical protein